MIFKYAVSIDEIKTNPIERIEIPSVSSNATDIEEENFLR